MTLKSHSWTRSSTHALRVFCSFMHTSQPVMKTWHFSPWTLHYCAFYYVSWVQFKLVHENSILIFQSSPDSFLTLCNIWICTDTNAVTTSSEEFSEQSDEQCQSSGSLSVNRLWGDDSTFSWASVYYCVATLQRWLTPQSSSSKCQVGNADSELSSPNTAEHTPTPTDTQLQ